MAPEPQHRSGATRRLIGTAVAALVVLLWASTSSTLSAWTSGVVANSTDTALTSTLVMSHSAGSCSAGPRASTKACSGTVLPSAASSGGTVTGIETLSYSGTISAAALVGSVSAASCAPVRLDNARGADDVMLPRYNTGFRATDPFGATNAVTLDGLAYAAAVTRDQQRAVDGESYGMGVWFKAAPGNSGPLMSLSTSPVNVGSTLNDDRAIFLAANGTLSMTYTTSGLKVSSTAAFNDGAWHFAYGLLRDQGLSTAVTLNVDSAQVASGTLVGNLSTLNAYWHLGWASTALLGLGSASYFTGTLSNAVAFNGATAQARPSAAQLATQSAFNSWAGTATDQWLLGDSGVTTHVGANPVIGTTSACGSLNIAWSFTGPDGTAVSTRSLAAFANGTQYPVPAVPAAGAGSQTSTVSITRDAGYSSYVAGLRLLVPATYTLQTSAGRWPLAFTWSTSDSVVIG